MARKISPTAVGHFASTSHKGLPKKAADLQLLLKLADTRRNLSLIKAARSLALNRISTLGRKLADDMGMGSLSGGQTGMGGGLNAGMTGTGMPPMNIQSDQAMTMPAAPGMTPGAGMGPGMQPGMGM